MLRTRNYKKGKRCSMLAGNANNNKINGVVVYVTGIINIKTRRYITCLLLLSVFNNSSPSVK